jgi:regulation of enolase protein 1 (concanavalin A-like superfamily)
MADPPSYFHLKGWGDVEDPDGDCSIRLEKDRLVISLPGKDHSLSIERQQMNSPRICQEVNGDFSIQVWVGGTFQPPLEAIVPGRRAFHGAGFVLFQDESNYLQLERAALVADGKTYHYASFEARKNGKCVRFASATDMPLSDQETLLRLERRSGKILAAISYDGSNWKSLTPETDDWPAKLRVGIKAGNNTDQRFSPEFREMKLSRMP